MSRGKRPSRETALANNRSRLHSNKTDSAKHPGREEGDVDDLALAPPIFGT